MPAKGRSDPEGIGLNLFMIFTASRSWPAPAAEKWNRSTNPVREIGHDTGGANVMELVLLAQLSAELKYGGAISGWRLVGPDHRPTANAIYAARTLGLLRLDKKRIRR
jgi:hypothetical protein